MLRDSARIQRDDSRNGSFRGGNGNNDAIEPLFDLADVEWVVEQFRRKTCRGSRSSRGRSPR